MRPRGRPPLPRGIFSFQDPATPVPPRVGLDTSFVVEALLSSQPLHGACSEYLARLAEAAAELVVSRLLELELRETAFQIALKERHSRDWKRFRTDGRARRRADRLMKEVITAWQSALESFVWTPVEIGEVTAEIGRLMTMGLASYDAVHAASAIASQVDALVTLDAGFALVPEAELVLYVDASRLASCRGRRT